MFSKKILATILVFTSLITLGQGCTKGGSKEAQTALTPVTLNYWRVFDDPNSMTSVIESYKKIHSNVSIQVKKIRSEEYEEELVRAFAEGRGPDIYSVHNTWVKKYLPLITPLPPELEIVYKETKGTIKKETIAVLKIEPTISIRKLQNDFVDVVAGDVIVDEKIVALPYSVDTLALFYNKDLLNSAGIASPPATWSEFQDQVKILTKLDSEGAIAQSGSAIGTADNIERSMDILSLLMMQNGTQMTTAEGAVTFANIPAGSTTRVIPASDATRFYTDFANPNTDVYTWNNTMPNSFDAFTSGTTAFFFGYSYHTPLIRARNPKLKFDIAKAPQIQGGRAVNYANYWLETVSHQTKNVNWAWDFIQFAARAENVSSFLDNAKKPTALRGLINTQLENLDLSVFASQVLTADDWYNGIDAQAAEGAMRDLINTVLINNTPEAINNELIITQNKVNQTL